MPKVPKPRSFCQVKGCDKSFSRNTDLVRHHKAVHDNIKVKCPYCDHRTGQMSNLENHKRTHTRKMLLCTYPDCPYETASTSGLHAHKVKMHGYEPGTRNRESGEVESVNSGSSSQSVAPAYNTIAPQSQPQSGVYQENFKPFFTSNAPSVDLHNVSFPPALLSDLYNTGTVPAIASGSVHSDMKPSNIPNTYYPPTMPSPTIMSPATGTILGDYEGAIHGDDVGAFPPTLTQEMPAQAGNGMVTRTDPETMQGPHADRIREGLAKYRSLSEEEKRACVEEMFPDRFFPELGLKERTEPKYVCFVDEFFSLQA